MRWVVLASWRLEVPEMHPVPLGPLNEMDVLEE
jgi:hypothetical protein